MHGEQHGVELRRDLPAFTCENRLSGPAQQTKQIANQRHLCPRKCQLPAHRQCQRSADQQHEQRGKEKLNSDDLVICREHIFLDKTQLVMIMSMVIVEFDCRAGRGHRHCLFALRSREFY